MKILPFAIAALTAVFLSGCAVEEAQPEAPRPVRTTVAHARDLGETVIQTGEIRPRHETAMSFRLDGQLLFRVTNGASVKEGDIVARMDETPAKNNVLTAKAELSTAVATLDLAGVTAQRNRDLFARNVASKAQLQEAEANLETATARVEAAKAALANAEENLSYTVLRAQRDGIISATGANEGQVVAAGSMVVILISDGERDAIFDVAEKFVRMELGNLPVEVRLVSDNAIVATGTVREVTPSADAATRTWRIRVGLDDGGKNMPFGAAVTGAVVLSPKKLVQLPASALINANGQPAVFIFDKATGKLKYRSVRIERFDDTTLLVAEGLSEGELVATAGVSKLRDGEVVTIDEGAAR